MTKTEKDAIAGADAGQSDFVYRANRTACEIAVMAARSCVRFNYPKRGR